MVLSGKLDDSTYFKPDRGSIQLTWSRQLLYYPFAAFFALFNDLIKHPRSRDAPQHLEHLDATVTYFSLMKLQLSSLSSASAKLEETARIFHSLASFIISSNTKSKPHEEIPHTATTSDSASEGLTPWSSVTPITDLTSYTDTFTSFLDSQDQPMVDLDGVNVNELFGCLDPEVVDSPSRKRTFDSAFDWFSWDSYYPTQLPEELHK